MIEHVRYRAKLVKLFRQKKTVRSAFVEDIRKAQKEGKPRETYSALEHQSYFEESMIDEEISILATDNSIRMARRPFVPIPSRKTGGIWEQCHTIGNRWVLTSKGISELRSSLRTKRKEQVELVVRLLVPLTGVIGAVTGLVAAIMK